MVGVNLKPNHFLLPLCAEITRLLLDTNLSAEAKLTGALLHTFEDGGLSAQELADVLTLPPEKVAPVFAELTGNGYLEILEENGAFGLHLKG